VTECYNRLQVKWEKSKYVYNVFSKIIGGVSVSETGPIREDPYWTSRENSLGLIKLSSVNKVSLV
jgi:hypothetical protein